MKRDATVMRGTGPTVFAQVKNGVGVPEIIDNILACYTELKQTSSAKKQKLASS